MQPLPSALQKKVDRFCNQTQFIRDRMKACLFIIEDNEKSKEDLKERIKGAVRTRYLTIINICFDVLGLYEDYLNGAAIPPKIKQELKIPLEVDETLRLLHAVFVLHFELTAKDIAADKMYKVLVSILQPKVPNKYKRYAFYILVNYMRSAKRVGIEIDAVSTYNNP